MTKRFQILDINEYTMEIQSSQDCTKEDFYRQFHISKTKQHKLAETNTIPDQIVKNQILYITFPITEYTSTTASSVDILYRDTTCMLVYKPGFLLVHSDGNESDTLQDRVNAYLLKTGWPHPAQAVQRIDYETSGLVLFCIQPFFQAGFDHMVAHHKLHKEYRCAVQGIFPWSSKTIDKPIGRNRHNAKAMCISPHGKNAVSIVTRLKIHPNSTLLNVRILTGRKHQIRVHLSSIGYPIINDPLYGTIQNTDGLLLQNVHMAFTHPIFHTFIDIECPLDQRIK